MNSTSTPNDRHARKSQDNSERPAAGTQATRETVESVVIAVILAFLFRGFVAEAFVIPTGSMAPTLMGRHVDVTCPQCRYAYRTGATEENEPRRGVVETTFCPICRYPLHLDRVRNPNQRSFTGDRILVSKFAYELSEPERWDVIVFKYPGNAKQNYIKRLIGLPGELIRIRHGDIYSARKRFEFESEGLERVPEDRIVDVLRPHFEGAGIPLAEGATASRIARTELPETVGAQSIDAAWTVTDGGGRRYFVRLPGDTGKTSVYSDFAIARKPPEKADTLMQTVHDTRRPGDTLVEVGWPERWRNASAEPQWRIAEDRSHRLEKTTRETAWLRYRHVYPSEHEWERILSTNRLPESIARASGELISDYYTYNDRHSTAPDNRQQAGSHWVGDLAVECALTIGGESGLVRLDLVEGGVHYECAIDVATGRATLSNSDGRPFVASDAEEAARADATGQVGTMPDAGSPPTAETPVHGPGTYRVRFANCDDELRLWIDGRFIRFDRSTAYAAAQVVEPRWSPLDPGDLAPVGIGVSGTPAELAWIRVLRDVYYLAIVSSRMNDYDRAFSESVIQDIFRSPEEWSSTSLFAGRRTAEFVIPDDHFFPLGDNSPESLDGRLWGNETYFERDLLIGKAMMVYWPHAWRRPIPFLPNFRRMTLIH